MIQKKTCE